VSSGSGRARRSDRSGAVAERRDAGKEQAGVAPSLFERLRARLPRDRGVWILLGIVLIAALPRVWYLMSAGFRGDEAVYAGQAGILSGDDELRRYFVLTSRGNSNFLLYQQFVALIYFVFGVSDTAARLVSVAFSIGTVVVTFELARTLYTKRIAYISALAIALSGYAVLLGRLALLDSTLTFFFALSLLAFAKWVTGGRRSWLFCFAAAASLTAQAKVTGILVLMIALLYLLLSRELWRLNRRDLVLSALVFVAFLTPAAVQVLSNTHDFFAFLSDSSQRVTHVSWHYYLDKLGHFGGYPILVVWAIGIAVALRIRNAGDRLLLGWVLVLALFFQAYPLKAFNYLLPLIPPLSILGSRGLYSGAIWLQEAWQNRNRPGRVTLNGYAHRGLGAPLVATCALVAASIVPVTDVAQSDSYFGLREAAHWLHDNTEPDAGVMTLSKGSAQYALSFYAHRDAYPYGRFRLATILPGGHVRSPRPAADGTPSRDWVSYWPPRLIRSRTVSYLVYYTDEGDDPPEAPIVESQQQKAFRNFIETFGGQLVHTVRRHHEGRAWIYRVTKLQPYPTISFARHGGRVVVRGEGFRFDSPVTVYYHRVRQGKFQADPNGSFTGSFPLPLGVQPKYYMVAVDKEGDVASRTGLTSSTNAPAVAPPQAPPTGAAAGGFRSNGHPRRIAVELDAPNQVPVGSSLPIVVHVRNSLAVDFPTPQAHVVLSIRSRSGSRVFTKRLKQKTTNTLGNVYFNLTSLELPAFYTMSAYVEKDGRRGAAHAIIKVRRR